MAKSRKINLMIIEDNEVEAFILEETIAELNCVESVQIFEQASYAFNYLLNAKDEDLPDLVLLDLNLDRGDGFEFMEEIEFSNRFPNGFPFKIYMLTNSTWEDYKEIFSQQDFASVFMQKPLDTVVFQERLAQDFPA